MPTGSCCSSTGLPGDPGWMLYIKSTLHARNVEQTRSSYPTLPTRARQKFWLTMKDDFVKFLKNGGRK